MYQEGPLTKKPLHYVIRCAGCGSEIQISPLELAGRMVICTQCHLANPTRFFDVRGRLGGIENPI